MLSSTELVTSRDRVGIVRAGEFTQPIRITGTQKAQQVVREFAKYGIITFSREQNFKSSVYSLHFIKPVEKLKQLYNLGDEVLILCCNDAMANFKSRTKDFIDYLLASQGEFKNRLDKITCFLIDDNDNIVEIIKQDRTESPDTRLIVPFSYAELSSGLNDLFLQERLRAFLYERDLFGIASPLKNDTLFFGKDRTNVISELYGKYRQGEHGGVFGLRRIGKTSVLNLLRRRIEEDNGAAIYLDCTKYHLQRWNSFLHQIIIELQQKYAYDNNDSDSLHLPQDFSISDASSRYNEAKAMLSFESDLASLYHGLSDTRILLIFDEIELISYETSPSEHWRSGNDALYFWQTLRSISQTNSNIFSFVITGVNPKCIEASKINGYPNPIFNVLSPLFISLFELSDVKRMVSDIGGYLGLRFDEEIFTKLIEDYGGHPFLTRQVCSRINSDVLARGENRPFLVTKYSYSKYASDYRTKMEGVISQILDVLQDYYPKEFSLLKTLALNGSREFKKQLQFGENTIGHLLGYCLIKKDAGDYYIRIKSIEEYLNEKYKYEKILYDDASKRLRVSERRNAIEVKLRDIIAHQISMKYGKKAKEKLIDLLRGSTKDESQTAKLQALDFRKAMQEVYFMQLKHLIEKDWAAYQALFADKVKFQQFFELINRYRTDAHAKDIDEDDEALLNIAFKYFEKALQDL
jgi:hypothetical protein